MSKQNGTSSTTLLTGRVQVAAVQARLRPGAVEDNLIHLEDLIRDAVREHRPSLVIVPEEAASPAVNDPALSYVARPIDGAPMQLYRQLARELDIVVGGGFLAHRNNHLYSTYVLAEPDGRLHLHDKTIASAWGSHHCETGRDNGRPRVAALGDAPVGVATGWEWVRTDTARRLHHRVQLLTGGLCWPSFPMNWKSPFAPWMRREHALQLGLLRELPSQMARLLGAPVAIASQVGTVSLRTPVATVPWRTKLVGETQIVDQAGTVLARLGPDDGEGHIGAEVRLGPPQPTDPITDRTWIPSLSRTTRATRRALRLHGALTYRTKRLMRLHPWQRWPAADLLSEIGPGDPAEQPVATSGPASARPR